jgi:hypothetical protein
MAWHLTYVRIFVVGENLMQFAWEVGGSPLSGGQLLQWKIGIIAIGVIDPTLRRRSNALGGGR